MMSLSITFYKNNLNIMQKGENKNLLNKKLAGDFEPIEIENNNRNADTDNDSDSDSDENKTTEEETIENNDDKENIVSKHKQSGKHSLQYDTIFKGSKEIVDDETDTSTTYHNDTFTHDPGSHYHHETINNHDYIRERELKQKIYDVLLEHTEINFMNNRRKPSKSAFNEYYQLLKLKLNNDNFTNIEVFIELSFYFSDNLFNMFKLLEPKWRDLVIDELQEHIGKRPSNSKEITPRNLSIDAEIEFYIPDTVNGGEIIVTGVIKEQRHSEGIYIVDSYESLHEVSINDIEKILNNTKFKYNLNKLNNIDFL